MPAFPELGGTFGFIGRIEVFRQIETHQHGHANGNVSITREVGVNLQRVTEQSCKVLKASVKQWLIEHAVDEVDGDVVAQDDFLHQTVHDPENSYAELFASEEILLMELWNKFVGSNNRTCHQLRKETDVEAKVEDVVDGFDAVAIHIHDVTDSLEGIKRNAHRQQDGIDAEAVGVGQFVAYQREDVKHLEIKAKQVVDHIGDEVGVLEIKQQRQVDDDADAEDEIAAFILFSRMHPLGREEVV